MKLKDIINIEDIKNLHNQEIDRLADIEINNLSQSNLSFIKNVSLSSIHTMIKAGRDNEYILTHGPDNKGVSTELVKKYLGGLDEAALLAMGFKKI